MVSKCNAKHPKQLPTIFGAHVRAAIFWIFPNLDGQRNPKWPAKPRNPNDSYLRAFIRTVRVVGKKGGSWF